MAEEKKGVNVKTLARHGDGVDHEKSTAIWVDGGHLHVGRSGGGSRTSHAIYAPGQWISATVNE